MMPDYNGCEQVYHVDKYGGHKGPGWEEWLIVVHDITVELSNRIEIIRNRKK